ncbi:hypothetical protein GIB67_003067 [Kingdonia uniflora]|uniref:Uncharacterized protein n=1 Tax=Kingdonia uniflora TaxID=39325 RepID=A0A7J7N5N9_9MAGN|nr:hypothetical protein GIB67_003067 [Kingdonia uniflora]
MNPSTIKGTMQVFFLRLSTFPVSIDVLLVVFTSKCLYPVSIRSLPIERKKNMGVMCFLLQLKICNMLSLWMSFTRYSRHLVLSKTLLYLEEKNDLIAAAVAKEALEGHYIYDGGYCKLYLSYSRHIDLNVKA